MVSAITAAEGAMDSSVDAASVHTDDVDVEGKVDLVRLALKDILSVDLKDMFSAEFESELVAISEHPDLTVVMDKVCQRIFLNASFYRLLFINTQAMKLKQFGIADEVHSYTNSIQNIQYEQDSNKGYSDITLYIYSV